MRDTAEMTRSYFYTIVGICAVIIMVNSLETMMRAKDIGLYEMWINNPGIQAHLEGQTAQQMHSSYISMCLSTFFVRIVTPMGIALHSYWALKRVGINKMFVSIWTLLIIATIALLIIGESFYSIFFIITIVGYIALLVIILYALKFINYKKML